MADLVDRLSARFGPGAVQRFLPHDSHVPERAARRVPAIGDGEAEIEWARAPPASRPCARS